MLANLTQDRIRRLFARAAIALGIAAAIGYPISAFFFIAWTGGSHVLWLNRGALVIEWEQSRAMIPSSGPSPAPPGLHAGRARSYHRWHWLPRIDDPAKRYPNDPGRLVIPFWLPILLGLYILYRRLPVGAPAGHCPRCRYDLKDTPHAPDGSLVCPECGTAARAAPPAGAAP